MRLELLFGACEGKQLEMPEWMGDGRAGRCREGGQREQNRIHWQPLQFWSQTSGQLSLLPLFLSYPAEVVMVVDKHVGSFMLLALLSSLVGGPSPSGSAGTGICAYNALE